MCDTLHVGIRFTFSVYVLLTRWKGLECSSSLKAKLSLGGTWMNSYKVLHVPQIQKYLQSQKRATSRYLLGQIRKKSISEMQSNLNAAGVSSDGSCVANDDGLRGDGLCLCDGPL